MSSLTLFLVTLIIALIMGNVLLFLFNGTARARRAAVASIPAAMHASSSTVAVQKRHADDDGAASNAKIMALEKKIELAHRRIQDLEGVTARTPLVGAGEPADEALRQRFEKLERFKSTAQAELVAMKEILAELQNNHITVKARTFKNGRQKEKDISREEMHKIIYRSSS